METDNNMHDYNRGFEQGYRQGFSQGYQKADEHRSSAEKQAEQQPESRFGGRQSGGRYEPEPGIGTGTGYGYQQGEGFRQYDEDLSGKFVSNDPFSEGPEGKSRGVAAILAMFLGMFGIQYFYLGKVTAGVLSLIVSVILACTIVLSWIPGLVWFVQGILMFCMSNADFRRKYVTTNISWPIF